MRRGGGERRVDHDAAAETHVSVSHGPGTGGTLAKLRRLIGCRLLAGREFTSGPSAKLGLAAAQQLAAELCTLSELGVTTSPAPAATRHLDTEREHCPARTSIHTRTPRRRPTVLCPAKSSSSDYLCSGPEY